MQKVLRSCDELEGSTCYCDEVRGKRNGMQGDHEVCDGCDARIHRPCHEPLLKEEQDSSKQELLCLSCLYTNSRLPNDKEKRRRSRLSLADVAFQSLNDFYGKFQQSMHSDFTSAHAWLSLIESEQTRTKMSEGALKSKSSA